MADNQDILIFHQSPTVEFAANYFRNVPVILQYHNQPLIEVVQQQPAGFTTQFTLFNKDGVYLAKVVGSRLLATNYGKKARISLEFPNLMTVCKLGNQVLFEVTRKEAAALKTEAELFTPDGRFLKARGATKNWLLAQEPLKIGGMVMTGNTISGCRIGVRVSKDGSVGIGCS